MKFKNKIECHGRNHPERGYRCDDNLAPGEYEEIVEMLRNDGYGHYAQGIPYRCITCGEIMKLAEEE